MQIILTEEEYKKLLEAKKLSEKEVENLASHRVAAWVQKAMPILADNFMRYADRSELLKSLKQIPIE